MSKLALLAFGTTAFFLSAAGTVALDHFGVVPMAPILEPESPHAASIAVASLSPRKMYEPAPEPFDRFVFVPFGADLMIAPPPQEAIPPVRPPEPAVANLWATETLPDNTVRSEGPRISAWMPQSRPRQIPMPRAAFRDRTLTKRLSEISPTATKRLTERFIAAKAAWPPADIAFVAVKDEKVLELHARAEGGPWKFIHRYPVLAASGGAGPKLRQGDKQVPEGVYRISYLNPSSRYHVSLRVNYPNAFDRQMAAQDGRHELGGDIMIHGKALSVGCLAVGDAAAEELFVLAADTGLPNIKVVIAPTDFRRRGLPTAEAGQPKWLPKLYTEVAAAMSEFKAPPRNNLLSSFFGN